jgi:hypothetical protein
MMHLVMTGALAIFAMLLITFILWSYLKIKGWIAGKPFNPDKTIDFKKDALEDYKKICVKRANLEEVLRKERLGK